MEMVGDEDSLKFGLPVETNEEDGVKSIAIFSPCRKYRYFLRRIWDKSKPIIVFLMLNPSTADAFKNDPTIRRCWGYAEDWGYGGFIAVNIYALRSTDPKGLKQVEDPIGIHTDSFIRSAIKGRKVVCAWGIHANDGKKSRECEIRELLNGHDAVCFGTTKAKHPKHPLYLKVDEKLVPFLHGSI